MFTPPSCRTAASIALVMLIGISSVQNTPAEEQNSEIDPAAEKRIRAMSEYLGNLKTFSVEASHTIEMEGDDESAQSYSDLRRVFVKQPNRLSITASGDSEGEVICDGKQLFAYMPSIANYLMVDAPEDFEQIMLQEAALLLGGAGRTALQLATGDSYDQFMKSTASLTLLEPELIGDTKYDRIEMAKENAIVRWWIEQGDRPLLHKAQWEMRYEMPAGVETKMPSQVLTFSNWEVDQPIADEIFAIEVPEDAEQVASFMTQDRHDDEPHPLLGAEAPDCELTLLDGDPQQLTDLKGDQVVVLDFWALWCAPCLEALPIVNSVAAQFSDRDVAFFTVNSGDDAEDIREFLEEQDLDLPIALDPESEISDLFHANSIPMTVIIDKEGVVQVVHIGLDSDLEKTLSQEIEDVIAGKQLAEETLEAAREAKRWGKPIPSGEDAITATDATEFELAFNLRTSVDSYKKVGSRNEAWDESAIEFLTEMSSHFSSSKGHKSRMELIEMAEPLVESGCDDPLVRYCHGAMLEDGAQDDVSRARGSRFVERSYAGLVERGYPESRCYAAAKRIWKKSCKAHDQEEVADKYLALTRQHALASVLDDDLDNHDGRTIYRHLNSFCELLPLETRAEFCEAAKAHEEASPFVVNMLVGQYHVEAGWKARGTSWATEVTEEGWKGFDEHMTEARECFEKAWEAAPNRPEAASEMIKISMSSSRSAFREMRMWFDRAVEAQFDYRPAYTKLVWGLMPRWHGSHDLIYQFGVECMNTERYDTDVPFMLCDNLWRIIRDNKHNPLGTDFLRKSGIYENVQIVCERYIDEGSKKHDIPWWQTTWLGFAYLTGHWDDAERLLEELDFDLNSNALGRFPLNADKVIAEVQIRTSPHADAITQAFQLADSGQQEEAIEELTALLDEEDLPSIVASRVRSRLQGLNWTTEFESGEPVSLIPERGLDGWKVVAGNWIQNPNGGLRGESDLSGAMLECETDFGTHWEIRGEVTHGKSPYNPWDAGILLMVDGSPDFSLAFHPTEKWVAAGPREELKEHRIPFEVQGRTTDFVIRMEDNQVNVWLNEELVIEDQKIVGLSSSDSYKIAIGAKYWWNGSILTYKNLVIEKVDH